MDREELEDRKRDPAAEYVIEAFLDDAPEEDIQKLREMETAKKPVV